MSFIPISVNNVCMFMCMHMYICVYILHIDMVKPLLMPKTCVMVEPLLMSTICVSCLLNCGTQCISWLFRIFIILIIIIIIVVIIMCNAFILRHTGKVRLADGLSPNEGRLEMYRHGTWYTVYYYYFTQNDATVVCRQLGYLT